MELTKLEEKIAEVYTLLRLIDIMISDDNLKNETYFFQTEGGNMHNWTAEALNKFAKDFEKTFVQVKLRKYMATAAQFLNLPQHQRTWDRGFSGS